MQKSQQNTLSANQDRGEIILCRDTPEVRAEFNRSVLHPLQLCQWGDFKECTGHEIRRYKLHLPDSRTYYAQLIVVPEPAPFLYWPRGPLPDHQILALLQRIGKEEGACFVKIEPDSSFLIISGQPNPKLDKHKKSLLRFGCRITEPYYAPFTCRIQLTKSLDELHASMKPKARYNISCAHRHGVTVREDNSPDAFEQYLHLRLMTMKRYGIRSHSLESHRKLWELMRKEGIAHLLITEYNGNVLAAWMLYRFRKTLHYPYGGSTRQNREVMPSYATMWEAIKFGKSCGCTIFDLWGCLGQTPRVDDAWAGLHRFKMAFSPSIYEYLGAYDIPSKP